MDFELTKQQAMAQRLFREFAEKEVKPLAAEIDEEERFPSETVAKMASYGFFGIPLAKEYGGQGCDTVTYALCLEELSRACATTGLIVAVHTSTCCDPILKYGSAEQKAKYLPDLLSGKKIGAFSLTEPDAGTDASGLRTKAVLCGDTYVLNGTKLFVTSGGVAGVYIVFAMTDRSKGNKGISAFIVEAGAPGFSIGKKELKMGIRGSSTRELIFENCIIPKENLLSAEGKGFGVALGSLDGGRVGIAAQALGIAQGAFDEALSYVKERRQFAKPLSAFQNTQFKMAELKTRIDAARLLVYRAAAAKDSGQELSAYSAMAKLFASETAMSVTTQVVQLFGGYGYTRDYPVERMMRDAKITEIYEGTSEAQKMVIAASIFK